jgi:DNA-binding transcriptional LysR family regulator
MVLDLRHLRLIVAIADSGSVNRAARELGLTQPAVSNQLRRVEERLGVQLFVRGGTGCEPTPFGHGVVTEARVALSGLDNIDRWLTSMRTTSRLHLGGNPGFLTGELARWMSGTSWGAGVSLYDEINPVTTLTMVGRGHLDLAVLYESAGTRSAALPGGVREQVIHPAEPVFVLAASRLGLPATRAVSLAAVAEHPWVDERPGLTPWSAYLRRICRRENLSLSQHDHTVFLCTMLSLVSTRNAVAPVRATFRTVSDDLVVHELADRPLTQSIRLVYRAGTVAETRLEEICLRLASSYARSDGRGPAFDRWWADRGSQELVSF